MVADPAAKAETLSQARLAPCVDQIVPDVDPARIGVLDDHDGRRAVTEFRHKLKRGICIVEIVVAELLALDLGGLRDPVGRRADGQVQRRRLVRVLAISQWHLEG